MLNRITYFSICCLLFTSLAFAQLTQPVKKIVNTGEEVGNVSAVPQVYDNVVVNNATIDRPQFDYVMNNITSLQTGYDLQSNGSAQQLWVDLNGSTLNAVFTTSQETASWTDRTCTYFVSMDGGVNWTNVGNVPPPAGAGGARAGFPAINGLSFGSVVIASHHNLGGGNTRTQISINSAPGVNDFVAFDPGNAPDGDAIWPRLGVTQNDNVVFAASVNGASFQYTNTLDVTAGTFSGYQFYDGNQAETYQFSTADDGTIGHAYLGNFGEAYYRTSSDGGLTWSDPEQIFAPYVIPGDTNLMGTIRGIDLVYVGSTPAIVFEVYPQTPDFASYFPQANSEIRFWSPGITDSTVVLADTNNVPFFPLFGTADVMNSLARPTIGKSEDNRGLFIGFQATTEFRNSTLDSTTYNQGMFMVSTDSGRTWTAPEVFTPESPRLDWDWVTVGEVNPVDGNNCTVHMVMQGDPNAGSQVNGSLPSLTAQFYHFSTVVELPVGVGVGDPVNNVNSFTLAQNYPNPFNPSTLIKYTLAERSNVVLKVYDVLGKEVATLVNTNQEQGAHEINFDASNLSSGLYVYTIQAGDFTASRKMMLLK
jgi:hypothetical protein